MRKSEGPVRHSSIPQSVPHEVKKAPGKGEAVGAFRTSGDGHRYRLAWLAEKFGLGKKKIFTIKDGDGNAKKVTANQLMERLKGDYGARLWEWAEQNYPELKGSEYLKEKRSNMQGISSREAKRIQYNAEVIEKWRGKIMESAQKAGFAEGNIKDIKDFLSLDDWQKALIGKKLTENRMRDIEEFTQQVKKSEETLLDTSTNEHRIFEKAYQKVFNELPEHEKKFLSPKPKSDSNYETIGTATGFIASYSGRLAASIVLSKDEGKTDQQIQGQLENTIRHCFNENLEEFRKEFNQTTVKWDAAIASAEKRSDTLHLIPGGSDVIKLYGKYKAEGNLAGIKKLESSNPEVAVNALYEESERKKSKAFVQGRKQECRDYVEKVNAKLKGGIKLNPMKVGAMRAYESALNLEEGYMIKQLEEKSANINALFAGQKNDDKDFVDWFENDFTRNNDWTVLSEKETNEIFEAVAEKFWNTANPVLMDKLKKDLTDAAKFLGEIRQMYPRLGNEKLFVDYKTEYVNALKNMDFNKVKELQAQLENLPGKVFEKKLADYLIEHEKTITNLGEFREAARKKFENDSKGLNLSATDMDSILKNLHSK